MQRFHSRGLNLLEAIECIYLPDSIEYIISLGHLLRTEIACSFGDGGFICHFLSFMFKVMEEPV